MHHHLKCLNPAAEGKKLTVDFTATKPENYQEFLDGEVRYLSLKKANPDNADAMYAENKRNAADHLAYLEKLASVYDA